MRPRYLLGIAALITSVAAVLLVTRVSRPRGDTVDTFVGGFETELRSVRELDVKRFTCLTCRIVASHLVSFGDEMNAPKQIAQITKGPTDHYFVSQTYMEGTVAVYDTAGRLSSVIGRKGQGPGEIGYVWTMAATKDGVYLVDLWNHRLNFVNGSLELSDSWPLKFSVKQFEVLPDGRLLAAFDRRTGPTPASFHYLSNSGEYLGAVLPAQFHSDEVRQATLGEKVATAASDGTIIIADAANYAFSLVRGGSVSDRVESPVNWFEAYSQPPSDDLALVPRIVDVSVDAENRAWFLITVPNPSYVAPPNLRELSDRETGATPMFELNKMYDTAIEVWDLSTRELLTGIVVDPKLRGFAAPLEPYTLIETDTGELQAHVWRLSLRREPH